jgi:hypothetical protein
MDPGDDRFEKVPIDFTHKEDPLLKTTDKAVIPVETRYESIPTGIQKVLGSQFLRTPAFAGVTNQFDKCFFMI